MDYSDDDALIFASNITDALSTNSTLLMSAPAGVNVSSNYSEYIVPPEKEGSPYASCASILFKSDLKVTTTTTFYL